MRKMKELIDRLYERGWVDYHKGIDYDPRGTQNWQDVYDTIKDKEARIEQQQRHITLLETKFDTETVVSGLIKTIADKDARIKELESQYSKPIRNES